MRPRVQDTGCGTMGTDETRVLNRITRKPLPIYGMARMLDNLRQRFDYASLPAVAPRFFRPALDATEVSPGETVEIAGLPITLFIQEHAVMETLGPRIGGFAYSTDLVRLPAESMALLHGRDTWVVGCFQQAPHKLHANLDQVREWVRILQPRRTDLTHMGSDLDYGGLRRTLPLGIEPGYYGQRFGLWRATPHAAAGDRARL
jgi:phosphoribosyl 1,2-cyclic phosphate phosphodiesterase